MNTSRNQRIRRGLVACMSFIACVLFTEGSCLAATHGGGGGGSPKPSPATFSGQATVVYVDIGGGGADLILSDTGPLPSTGGALEKSLLTANISQTGLALTAEVLHATTIGQGNASMSEASVANLDVTVAGVNIGADLLMARAAASCNSGAASISGSSEVVNLRVAGQSILVSGQPNQTVAIQTGLLNVSVIINEQQGSGSGGSQGITVNALHVVVNSVLLGPLAETIISSAHADISCGALVCNGGDFVTGGGWITGTPSGAKGNFGVAGGDRKQGLWGHLNYIDHGNGMHVKATSITGYAILDATTRQITGSAEINAQSGFTFVVVVSDKGEPGRNDTFSISLSNGYHAAGNLIGGNIQLHNKPAGCK
jgi:hypothetical protein